MSSRPAWSTEQDLGQAPKLQRNPVLKKKIKLDSNSVLFCFFFETRSHIAQAGPELPSYVDKECLDS